MFKENKWLQVKKEGDFTPDGKDTPLLPFLLGHHFRIHSVDKDCGNVTFAYHADGKTHHVTMSQQDAAEMFAE